MDLLAAKVKEVAEWYCLKPTGSEEEKKAKEGKLREETINAMEALRPRPMVITKIRRKVDDKDDWDMFLEEAITWSTLSKEWRDALAATRAKDLVGSQEFKGPRGSRFHAPKMTIDLEEYSGAPGRCGVWWDLIRDDLTQLNYPIENWSTAVRHALKAGARTDFDTFRKRYPTEGIEAWMGRMVKLYDVNRERILLKELFGLKQIGSFRDLRSEASRIFRGLEDYGYRFEERQRAMIFSLFMKQELWDRISHSKPESVEDITESVSLLGLDVKPDRGAVAVAVRNSRGTVPPFGTANAKEASRSGRRKLGSGKKTPEGKKKGPNTGVCFSFRDTGTCRFGEECRFRHERREGGSNTVNEVGVEEDGAEMQKNAFKKMFQAHLDEFMGSHMAK
jgi:hypothetical protein